MEVLDETLESHKHQIFRFAVCLLGNRADAEDVTQEVLVRLWENRSKLDPSRVRAWLARVTRNACIDLGRRHSSQRALIALERAGGAVEHAASRVPHAESRLELSELARRVKTALDALDEPYKTVVVLREIQGMRYDEIGQALELPVNTVKVQLHRGRRKLRDALREAGFGGDV